MTGTPGTGAGVSRDHTSGGPLEQVRGGTQGWRVTGHWHGSAQFSQGILHLYNHGVNVTTGHEMETLLLANELGEWGQDLWVSSEVSQLGPDFTAAETRRLRRTPQERVAPAEGTAVHTSGGGSGAAATSPGNAGPRDPERKGQSVA